MVSFGSKLKALREKRGMNQADLAIEINVTRPLVSMWEHDKAKPSLTTLNALENFFGVKLIGLLDNKNVSEPIPLDELNKNYHQIPLFSKINAGGFTLPEASSAIDTLLVDERVSTSCFALIVSGDSMEPLFSPGDIVIVDPKTTVRNGDFVIAVSADHAATLKEYRARGMDADGNAVFDLIPANPTYPTVTINSKKPGSILGVVVEHRRQLRRR